MTGSAKVIVARARALVGVPFRPQGRDPATGLDCVGLVVCSFEIPSDEVRRDYRLRGPHCTEIETALAALFRRVSKGRRRPGDVLLCAVQSDQSHLVVDCGSGFIHADAALRKVVETPGQPGWPVIAAFRPRTSRSS